MAARESSSPQDTVVQPHFDLEALEPRLLLTALVGGEVFHFQDAENQRVAISVTGNVVVEIVGATMNPENDVLLHELPGEFIQSTLGRAGFRVAGGYGAEDGIMPVNGDNDTGALTHLLDGAGAAFNPLTAFHEDIAFNAIAANKAGDTYGINFYSTVTLFGETQIVELVQFDNATGTAHVIADLGGRIATRVTPWGDPAVELVGVSAADFNPVEDDSDTAGDSWLYFVVQAGDDEMDYLFRVNVGAGNPTQIAQTVERAATNNNSNPQTIVDPNGNLPDLVIAPGAALWGAEPDFEDNEGDLTVTAIVFDERDNGDASRDLDDVVMYYYVTGGDQGFRQGGISSINLSMRTVSIAGVPTVVRRVDTSQPDTDLSWRSRTVVAFEDPVPRSPLDNITGIELVTDDPTQFEQYLWAVEGDGGSLRHVDIDGPNPGFAEDWGPLPDPQDDDLEDGDTQRGQALGDLAWNDTLLNPFTGSLGALMATDVDSDDLMFVDHRQRFPNTDAFIVFVTQGDPNGSITFTRVLDNGEDAVVRFTLQLWDDSVENFRIVGENDPIAVPGDTGGVLIGVLTADINPNINNEDLRVIWEGSISSDHYDDNGAIGAFPVGFDGLHPGVLVARSLLEYVSAAPNLTDRLLGNNLDNIGEMAISGDGSTLAVIDRDARDENGNALATPADQLAFVNPLTGKASTVGVSIMAGATPLTGVQGLDYGDPDFDGVEALYAIYDVLGTLTLGTIDTNTGAFTALGALGAGMTEVQAMAFSPDQRLWIVGYNSGTGVSTLYQINPANGATVAVIGILRDAETGENLANIGSMDFATSASFGNPPYRLLAHDRYNGRLVDIALSTSTILGTDYALVGANTATEDGSLRPTVGAITYDRANNRFFAVDNATGISPLDDESGAESAVLMRLTGFASDSAVQQDLGRLLIGGTVTGRIDISGTIDQFQVGWLALGNLFAQANPWGDFHVGGDMHSFIARAPIGYYAFNDTVSRARVQIDGRLGYFLNPGQLAGSLTVSNSPSFVNTSYLTERYFEIETLVNGLRPDVLATRIADQILLGYTANDPFVYNDSFDDAQFLAAVRSGVTGANSTRVSGRLFVDLLEEPQEDDDVIDPIDYYAVALMAGQQVLVQLITTSSSTGEALHVGVIDPNGHVLASDYSNVYPGSFEGQPFAFTATEPGVYIFAVAHPGDWNFNGIQDPGEEDFDTRADWVDAHYDLRIQQIGNLALGGLKAVRFRIFPSRPSPPHPARFRPTSSRGTVI